MDPGFDTSSFERSFQMLPARTKTPVPEARVNASHRCPLCAGIVRAACADRQSRVRCPSCLQIVVLDVIHEECRETQGEPSSAPLAERGFGVSEVESPAAAKKTKQTSVGVKESAARRIQNLEERVAELERALAEMRDGAQSTSSRLKWMTQAAQPDLSPSRADALRHNLRTIAAHRIVIQFPSGDECARERAQWFKMVFEEAQWEVAGPHDCADCDVRRGLCMATAIPVPPLAAATFMALRAAGFAVDAAFDPKVNGQEERLVVA
jgi:hypothetical protein